MGVVLTIERSAVSRRKNLNMAAGPYPQRRHVSFLCPKERWGYRVNGQDIDRDKLSLQRRSAAVLGSCFTPEGTLTPASLRPTSLEEATDREVALEANSDFIIVSGLAMSTDFGQQ